MHLCIFINRLSANFLLKPYILLQLWLAVLAMLQTVNTVPSGHVESRDCYPMHCWRVTHFYVLLHDVLHIRLSAGLAHFLFQGYRQLDAGCLGLKLQTDQSWPLIFRTIRQQKRDHLFKYPLCFPSVAIMALCRNVLQEDDILCELHVDTLSEVSDYSGNESLDSDNDVPTTSSDKQLRSSADPLTAHFPHPFFLKFIKTVFITVWD